MVWGIVDSLKTTLGSAAARSEMTGGQGVNILFSLMRMVAFLSAFTWCDALIPIEDRQVWLW